MLAEVAHEASGAAKREKHTLILKKFHYPRDEVPNNIVINKGELRHVKGKEISWEAMADGEYSLVPREALLKLLNDAWMNKVGRAC